MNSQSFGMRAPWWNTRMSPTFGPMSIVVAADTTATDSPAGRRSGWRAPQSWRRRARSAGSLVRLRHLIGRDLCRSASPAPGRGSVRRSRAGRPGRAGAVPGPAARRSAALRPTGYPGSSGAWCGKVITAEPLRLRRDGFCLPGTVSRLLASGILPFPSHMQHHVLVSLTRPSRMADLRSRPSAAKRTPCRDRCTAIASLI